MNWTFNYEYSDKNPWIFDETKGKSANAFDKRRKSFSINTDSYIQVGDEKQPVYENLRSLSTFTR